MKGGDERELYNNILKRIDKIVTYILVLLMIILVGTVFLNIIVRYFGFSFLWSDGVSRLIFVWLSFFGIYIGYRNNQHPSFSMIVNFIYKKNKTSGKVMKIIIQISVLAFLYVLVYGGFLYIKSANIQKIAVLNISVGWKYSAGPIVGILMVLEAFRKIVTIIKE